MFRKPRFSAPVACIDIGSNSVRLVIQEVPSSPASPPFQKSIKARLGLEIDKTGKLYQRGAERTLKFLKRCKKYMRRRGVKKYSVVGTAAIRRARDGKDFVRRIHHQTSIKVRILSGREEGKLSALGALSNLPPPVKESYLVIDLGGSSLELVQVNSGKIGRVASLDLGHLALPRVSSHDPSKIAAILRPRLERVSWLQTDQETRTLLAVGGSFRYLARLCMQAHAYPLFEVQGFKASTAQFTPFLTQVMCGGYQKSPLVRGVKPDRRLAMPYVAAVMKTILDKGGFRAVQFSEAGVRDGEIVSRLVKPNGDNPAIASVKRWVEEEGGDLKHAQERYQQLSARLKQSDPLLAILSSMLTEAPLAPGREKARRAYNMVLESRLRHLTHPQKMFLGVALYSYYARRDFPTLERLHIESLIGAGSLQRANKLGLALAGHNSRQH
ncbi:MAG: hypothetical protein AB7G80_02100 [Dongiaceae bacterium]